MNIYALPAFSDNYIWALVEGQSCWVVDPGQAEPVEQFIEAHGVGLEGIFITHHHPDHAGGIQALSSHRKLRVVGPNNPQIKGLTETVNNGNIVDALGHSFHVYEVPGHTLDHIAFYSDLVNRKVLFCGDTLFAGGCGRLFEGTAQQMWRSLTTLASLPDDTEVYAAHEYTTANLNFAAAVDPHNTQLATRIEHVAKCRQHGISTLPSTIRLEKATNPFLRTAEADLIDSAQSASSQAITDECSVFAALRAYKDRF